jgi:uncharacterized membrane protein YqaE (UPF0057 family)
MSRDIGDLPSRGGRKKFGDPGLAEGLVWALLKREGLCSVTGVAVKGEPMVKVLLVLLCLVLPFVAVLIKKGPCIEVLWAFLLQLLGHIPGVIYGIYQVVKD